MKKIQAKKKKDRAEAEAEALANEKILEAAPHSGENKSILDKDDDVPILFT